MRARMAGGRARPCAWLWFALAHATRRGRAKPTPEPTYRVQLWADRPTGAAENVDDFYDAKLHIWAPKPPQSCSSCLAAGTAVVILPGGAYDPNYYGWGKLHEGAKAAQWLATLGVISAVLHYRLPRGRPLVPLSDALRAIETVRARPAPWALGVQRVGVMGFSAGGHLAATAATQWSSAANRPDFALLMYPVVTMRSPLAHRVSRRNLLGPQPHAELVSAFSAELRVTSRTPPALVVHALDDTLVSPKHGRLFCNASHARGGRCDFVPIARGGHAFVNKPEPWRQCTAAVADWLLRTGEREGWGGKVDGSLPSRSS